MQGSANTARRSIHSGLINAKFVNYNNWALSSMYLPSINLSSFFPDLPPLYLHIGSDQILEVVKD